MLKPQPLLSRPEHVEEPLPLQTWASFEYTSWKLENIIKTDTQQENINILILLMHMYF